MSELSPSQATDDMDPNDEARTPIKIHNLVKAYGDFEALRGISLEVQRGEIYGFLGPNGAGKTTTIRTLMGMLVPKSGQADIMGYDCQDQPVEVKRRTGYLPDQPEFYDYLRGRELLHFAGRMHGIPEADRDQRTERLLEQFDLGEAADEFAVNYSAGMKQKLALAHAQIHDPPVFLLDEPTGSLDPAAARDVKEWIVDAAESNRTVFLSTHLMEMAEELCDRVGIIHQGDIMARGTLKELMPPESDLDSLEDVYFEVTGEDFTEVEKPSADG